jgi:hypothetical protein
MFEKRISKSDVLEVISSGEVIAGGYPGDKPFPSSLILGFVGDRPIHVVSAIDLESQTCHIITVYRPDSVLWSDDFKLRRKQ